MNVSTVKVDPEFAKSQLQEYRNIEKRHRRAADSAFRKLWRAATSGKPILDLQQAFTQTGLNDKGLPRLGMARVGWSECHFDGWNHCFKSFRYARVKADFLPIFGSPWDWSQVKTREAFTKVPEMPPHIRRLMKYKDENYFTLFEVKDWSDYPADPFLLWHITNNLYVVLGEWELSPLEVSLLKGLVK